MRFAAVAVTTALVLGACSSDEEGSPTSTTAAGTTGTDGTATTDGTGTTTPGSSGTHGFTGLRLSQGQAGDTAAELAVVDGTPLDDATLQGILARLPEFVADALDVVPFNWPAQSSPPPLEGATIAETFPAEQGGTPPETTTGPLHVLRAQPEGEVGIAPFLTITFDQPMVPVATIGQLAAADVPATITPDVPGTWQWIGTRTLRFDADREAIQADRLPMATEFTVEVPAGTTSATGGELAETVAFGFTTPPPVAQWVQPSDESLPLVPVFVASFDQRVDPAAVLETIVLEADGDEHPVRLATAEEIAADDMARMLVDGAVDGRWVAFRPVDPLPADAAITIDVGPGTPSAEGPLTTTEAASFSARTFAPLRVDSVDCGYGSECRPGMEFDITFNNSLDLAAFDAASITVDPAPAGLTVTSYGQTLVIIGNTQANTDYTVTLPAGLLDEHGQTLGEDVTETISVGDAQPSLRQFALPMLTVDPFGDAPSIDVVSTNHDELRVRTFAVTAKDWPSFAAYLMESFYGSSSKLATPPWDVTADDVVEVEGAGDGAVATTIDLSATMPDGLGHTVVIVEPAEQYSTSSDLYWMNRPTIAWVQGTRLGVDAISAEDEIRTWVTDLRTGAPLEGVELASFGRLMDDSGEIDPDVQVSAAEATTSTDGLGTLDMGAGVSAIVATAGDDTAILSPSGYPGDEWRAEQFSDETRWYVIDDRGVYRPGETVSMKGWVRRLARSSDGGLQLIPSGSTIDYTVTDAVGATISDGTVEVNPLGGFDLTVDVPESANTGMAYVQFTLTGTEGLSVWTGQHSFEVADFRTPEFEVTAQPEGEGPYVDGEPVTVAVDATYYAGGPLPDAAVTWQVTPSSASYSPPGWEDFTFGIWSPWWWYDSPYGAAEMAFGDSRDGDVCCGPIGTDEPITYTGTTDASGSHYLQIDVGDLGDDLVGLPIAIDAQATVEDVNRQAWAASTSVLVHPSDLYVGLASDTPYVERGDDLVIDVVVAGIDGAAVAGRDLQVTASRMETVYRDGQWTEQAADTETCDITSGTEPVACTFTPDAGGSWTIAASVTDDAGRSSRSELTRWVSGETIVPTRLVEAQTLDVVPDHEQYQPGDTAQLLVRSPIATGHGIAVVSRDGIDETITFDVVDGSAIVAVPIDEQSIPNLTVTVEVVGATARLGDDGQPVPDAPEQPAYAAGGATLPVPPTTKELGVTITPAATELLPGDDTQVTVDVTDASGQPVEGAELAVIVVDEAVLAVSGYDLADPLGTFYASAWSYVRTTFGRQGVVLVDPDLFAGGLAATGGDGDDSPSAETEAPAATTVVSDSAEEMPSAVPTEEGGRDAGATSAGGGTVPIAVRSDFGALAVFAPEVTTDAEGRAVVDVPLPDNLTRYRVMVVAASGAEQFGSAQTNITARLPLMVRPSAPRFLNFGDTFELPVVVQNQTDADMEVDVVLQTSNLTPAEPSGQRVTVPANDRIEVRFPVSAAQVGTARYRVAAVSGDASDAASGEMPVYTPSTTESFATYGVVDAGSTVQPVLAPTDVIPQFGGLEITTSSTALAELTDAVLYLADYRYSSADAMASRILAMVALRDVLEAFDADGMPTAAEWDDAMRDDIDGLVALQNFDGGFASWRQGFESDPFATVQAVQALVAARDAGESVPDDVVDAALPFLDDIESYIPSTWSRATRDTIVAYSLRVRMIAGDRDTKAAAALWNERGEDLPLDAIAWLWPVVDDGGIEGEISDLVDRLAVDTAGAVTFTTSVADDAYVTLASDRRTDGLLLDALIAERPDSDLVPKVVAGLLASRTNGHWDNVQENSFILVALRHYFDAFESATPDFTAGVWLGDRAAGSHDFVGRSTDRVLLTIPTSELVTIGDADIVIGKDGEGRLYYRIGLRTAPSDLQLDPAERGFVVVRTYEGVDDPADVTRDADGTWHIKAGARVRVRLTMVAESQRTNVALVDPLAAGLEIVDTTSEITQDVPADLGADSDASWWWWGQWYDHVNVRDDRAEAIASWLPAGTYDYSYVARATTPGTFVAPPARAEEIYAPETFGRSGTDVVVVDA